MAQEHLKSRLKEELPAINQAIADALPLLPLPCQPVARHVVAAGGKRLRPFLVLLCARMCGYAGKGIYPIAATVELLHAATLLHDDVLDGAVLRRGQAAAHEVFNVHDTILAGDALLALGNLLLAQTNDSALSRCYAEATMATAAGEILEMASLGDAALPPEKYLEIARGKTACLMAQACVLGALAAHAPSDVVRACRDYGDNLGLGFQLVDDVLDFTPEARTGKPSGGDLREGKLTPPIRLYRDSLSGADREVFNRKFADHSFDSTEMAAMVRQIETFAPQALQEAAVFLRNAKNALKPLPDNSEKAILEALTEYVLSRTN